MKTTQQHLLSLITRTKNIFRVTFIKKDGTVRRLVGCFRAIKAEECTVNLDKYFLIWDLQNKGYRAVNKSTILEAKINGTVYESNN
jgi:hypothetical protein